jgi:hypothetical protein
MYRLEPFEGSTVATYEFTKTTDEELRLLRINVLTAASNDVETMQGLAAKFGDQGTAERKEVQNGFGAKFPQVVWTWKNTGQTQTAVLTSPSFRQDTMSLEFLDMALLRVAAARGFKAPDPSQY